ncbi:MAG: DNA polymerase III subunit alpha [Bacteroidales bacterium]|jgi:DNA polymerase-3 subunit alpha|nr:DNA polymerase III subunit alpha [Bacteroidales bacterium]
MFLIFDTETTGLPRNYNAPVSDSDNWPRMVQLAWQLHDELGNLVEQANYVIKPEGFTIPFNATKVHGITTDHAQKHGVALETVLEKFEQACSQSRFLVGHNIDFDLKIAGAEYFRIYQEDRLKDYHKLDTCTETTASLCQLPGGRGGKFKLPNLAELHKHLFQEGFDEAHNASADVAATARCFLELLRTEVFKPEDLNLDITFFEAFKASNPVSIPASDIEVLSNTASPDQKVISDQAPDAASGDSVVSVSQVGHFAHLRNHTTYSILNATTDVTELVKKAAEMKMPAVGVTDTGNLMAAFHFVTAVGNHNAKMKKEAESAGNEFKAMKAVLGSEIYVCRDHTDKTNKDNGFLIPFFAKNKHGYKNLSMLSSISHTDGFYYVPRIDKNVLLTYKEDLIVTSGALSGEIPSLLLNVGEAQAEEAVVWWKANFGADFYLEINRHGLPEEDHLNAFLLEMARKYDIKYFASNNTYYLKKEEAEAHDFLLCIKDNAKKQEPVGRGHGFRFGFPNDEFYFKSPEEMLALFADIPEAIDTISEIIEKIEPFELKRNILLPEFEIPEQFKDEGDDEDHGKRGENAYLRHLAYEGARKRYGEITETISSRLDFELETIQNTGYPGYFLIVQDLIAAARKMGVWVGPGRGSAAGSLVAYAIGITNIDPLKYGLLFERFLNPERISMPDIDIDFDDEGRAKVIDYVTNKYGQNKVAQIITYGTLGTKSAIRDIGRVLDVDLPSVNKLAASTQNVKLGHFFSLNEEKLKKRYRPDQIEAGLQLKKKMDEEGDESKILKNTLQIEGLVRNTGIHACGFVITPTDLRELVPVTISKDANLWVTQFDNSVAESAGLLKIDFLGLKTLSLIRDTIEIIEQRHNKTIVADDIPLDDPKTYELFQHGETIGVFQYESVGMQKNLRELKPTAFADLIAMNALYRPGPMAYIPNYIKRKHGQEEVSYDLEEMREILEETYGITVYQEQVMLLSQKLAGFSRGQADTLRKAMGKKNRELLVKLYTQFIEGGKANGHDPKVLEKIWSDWNAFADYAFNKSHSTCYAFIAFQTAYLKANYPAEFMASVLSNNIGDIKQVTFFIEECRRMKIKVLGPDVNESEYKFTVNDNGEIRFGLGAVKNLGEAAVASILAERKENGQFKSVLDFLSRINLRQVNKRSLEALATSGAFDSFEGVHRAVFFYREENDSQTFLERAIKLANQAQEAKSSPQFDLFGGEVDVETVELTIPQCEPWSKMRELQMELESIGFYISAHPLDMYKIPIRFFSNAYIQQFKPQLEQLKGSRISFAGQVMNAEHLTSQQGKPYARFRIEDHSDAIDLVVFGETYLKIKHLIDPGAFVLVHGVSQPDFRNKEQFELKVVDMQLLDNLLEQTSKEVLIKVKVDEMSETDMHELIAGIKENPGKQNFSLRLVDQKNKLACSLKPMQGRINAQQVLPLLEPMNFVEFELK